MNYRNAHVLLLATVVIAMSPALGGEISGLPPHLAPTQRPDYQFYLGNDFLVPGTNDDFRTQQIMATARFRERWVAVLDHSMFTNEDSLTTLPQRIDTMTLSLGYEFVQNITPTERTIISGGIGVRGVGNFAGARIQNGIHRLVESDISTLPYSTTRKTDLAVWGLAERYRRVRDATGSGFWNGWHLGYWARAGLFATADQQTDAVAGLYAVASRNNYDVWLGLRQDWRNGYAIDSVLQAAAAEEQKTAVAWGVRMGAVVIESVYRIDSSSSYGQISFISSNDTRKNMPAQSPKVDLQLGLHLPHALFQLAVRLPRRMLLSESSQWREALLFDIRAGQPQFGNDTTRFVETTQATLGMEWSRRVSAHNEWLRFYGNVSAGLRSEQLLGRGTLFGEESGRFDKAVVVAGLGLEIDTARLGQHWRHSLRIGITGWQPSSSANTSVGGEAATIQEPDAAIVVAWSFNYH